jgi:NADPH:quinone reductase-like Zn-dependent oxidoreductase
VVRTPSAGCRRCAPADSGQLRVLIQAAFPLAEAAAAHELGEQGRTLGKIVLVP